MQNCWGKHRLLWHRLAKQVLVREVTSVSHSKPQEKSLEHWGFGSKTQNPSKWGKYGQDRGGNLPNRASSPGPQLTSKYYTCKDRTTIKDSVVSMEEICCKYDKGITHNSQLRGVTRESASPCEMKNNFKKGEKTDPIEGGMKMFRSQNVQGLAKRQRQNSTMKIMCYLANF